MRENQGRDVLGLFGIAEVRMPFKEALASAGKKTSEGFNAIVYVRGFRLTVLSFFLRLTALIAITGFMITVARPFSGLPVSENSPDWLAKLLEVQFYTSWHVIGFVFFFLCYMLLAQLKNSRYAGQPGVEIHFTRFKKIVKTIKPGEVKWIFNPFILPGAVVTTKPFPVDMPTITAMTQDNITFSYRSSLILMIEDTYMLMVAGGLEKFFEQLVGKFESAVKDHAVRLPASNFNRFMIEPLQDVQAQGRDGNDIGAKLDKLAGQKLTAESLGNVSEISELDVSQLNLREEGQDQSLRQRVIGQLKQLAEAYGIVILDHLPQGNMTGDGFMQTLSAPLVSSLTRLSQLAAMLKATTRDEIAEEIAADVADKELKVLGVQRIINEILSVMNTLQDDARLKEVQTAKRKMVENIVASHLAEIKGRIEAMIEQARSLTLQTAAHERWISESQVVLAELKNLAEGKVSLPQIKHAVLSDLNGRFLPSTSLVDDILSSSGSELALEELLNQVVGEAGEGKDSTVKDLENEIDGMQPSEVLKKIASDLHKAEESGSDSSSDNQLDPDSVKKRVEDLIGEAERELERSAIQTNQESSTVGTATSVSYPSEDEQ